MKILAIGNSFSQDATRYLRELAKADGEKIKVVNLYIGGCSLWRHYVNVLDDRRAYQIQLDGESTGFFASVKEGLLSDNWDVVTLQQASGFSYNFESYEPYLSYLADYVRKYAPNAKLYIHQTWAYEEGSDILKEHNYSSAKKMYCDLKSAYEKAADLIKADGVIPSGELMDALLQNGLEKVHRDGFHLTLGAGRYAAALLWYGILTGKDATNAPFNGFDEPVSAMNLKIVKETVRGFLR